MENNEQLKKIINHCSNRLGITPKYLAHILGLTELGVHSEKGQKRIRNIKDFLEILRQERPDLDGQDALFFIENERLVFDSNDTEDGHCSYLTAIISSPTIKEDWALILRS